MNHVYTFSGLTEFLDAVDKPFPGRGDNCAWQHGESWYGCERPQAFTYAREGWEKGRENMVEAVAQARPSITIGPAFSLDVAGSYPDPAAAAAGAPDCMVTPTPEENKARPIIRLAVNIWASGAYSDKEFTSYGAAILSYIDGLEANGYRVELTMLCHCYLDNERDSYTAMVPVKRAEEHMELDRLTFCFTHPSMLRRMFFAHMQLAPEVQGSMRRCGMPRNPREGDVDPGMTIVPGINTIKPGSLSLKSPQACAEHLSTVMSSVFTQCGVDLPPLAFGARA